MPTLMRLFVASSWLLPIALRKPLHAHRWLGSNDVAIGRPCPVGNHPRIRPQIARGNRDKGDLPVSRDRLSHSWQECMRRVRRIVEGSCWVPGWWAASPDQAADESAEQSLAAATGVVHELEETEIQRQFVLR